MAGRSGRLPGGRLAPAAVPADASLPVSGPGRVVGRADGTADKPGMRDLLENRPGFQDLLGLLTAAGGGLALADLEDMGTGLASLQIQAVLRDCSGPVFAARVGDGDLAVVHDLASEAVRTDAAAALGAGLLASYRQRLHEWSGRYRELGWPAGTPAYLIRDYPKMLREAGEAEWLTECATDRARHGRMFADSGGDLAAREEIAEAQAAILAQDDPDLDAMARLALHRADLEDRGSVIPTDLPAVWVTLGRPDRGENMAMSIASEDRRTQALAGAAAALTATGRHDRVQPAAAAEARSASDHATQTMPVAGSLARDAPGSSAARPGTGPADDSGGPVSPLAARAADLAAQGRYDEAEEAARSLADPGHQAHALTALAQAIAAAAMPERAAGVAFAAEAAILTGSHHQRDQSLSHLVIALAEARERDQAEALSRQILDPGASSYPATTSPSLAACDVSSFTGCWPCKSAAGHVNDGNWALAAAPNFRLGSRFLIQASPGLRLSPGLATRRA